MSGDLSRRRGRCVIQGRNGKKKAKFLPGSAAGPAEFDAAKVADDLRIWWEDGGGGNFLIENPETKLWSEWPKPMVVNLMRSRYVYTKSREGEILSETNRVLLHVMQSRRIAVSLNALAGYKSGVYEICGQQILIKSSPRLLDPKEGDWPTIKALIEGKLNLSAAGGPDQVPYFHGWMKIAVETLYQGEPGNFRPGQCVIFAGPRDCGKSRLQHQVVTGLLGRSADPGPFIFGKTDFNAEVFASEHLLIEDPASSTRMADRTYFGEELKRLLINDTQRLHRKHQDALVGSPFCRVTISINDDPDKMRVLPVFTPDLRDKLMLFRVSCTPLPMPAASMEERAAFRKRIQTELPAYAWWLLHVHTIAPSLRSARFGVRAWIHKTLAIDLFDDTPAGELLQLIDQAQWAGKALWERTDAASVGDYWQGTAVQLERLLTRVSSVRDESVRLFARHRLDRLLARLREDRPDRISHHRTGVCRYWRVRKPIDLAGRE